MTIEIPKESAKEAVLSIRRYFEENMDNEIGNLAAEGLLQFFVEEFGYLQQSGRGCAEHAASPLAELDVEIHEDEFGYWRNPPATLIPHDSPQPSANAVSGASSMIPFSSSREPRFHSPFDVSGSWKLRARRGARGPCR